jgi:hypothetical protein
MVNILTFLRFKNEMKDLCAIVEQLLDDALSITCNVEDALNVLQSLHYFSSWPQLNSHFKKKTDEVYAMLINEITFAMQFYTGNSYRIPSFVAKYSGVCLTAMTEYRRITSLKNVSTELLMFVAQLILEIIDNTKYLRRKTRYRKRVRIS